jgi:Oxidoreductase molybdopterin binding domain
VFSFKRLASVKGTVLRFTNISILVLLGILTLSGVYGLLWQLPEWLYEVHRIAAWALVALIPWKAAIALQSLRRGLDWRFDRSLMLGISLTLAAMALTVLTLGFLWTWRIGPLILWLGPYGDTLISYHWMLALILLAPLAIHVWRRWPKPKQIDFTGRRNVLKLIALGGVGVAGWGVAELVAKQRQIPASPRRFTGSREEGSWTGLAYPVTTTIPFDTPIDPAQWTLRIEGAVNNPLTLTYADLLARPATDLTATLDCTTGWYTNQIWRGVPLTDLLTEAQIHAERVTIQLKDVLGYAAYYSYEEAAEIVLATHSGGQVLDHVHGFPVRAAAASRRGWQWVKWLTIVEVVKAT